MNKQKKVIVGMSGGVDSSVSAALLKKQGFEVVGAFMRLVDSKKFKRAEKYAARMARRLGVSFLVFDFRSDFKKKIIERFLKGYSEGDTPNPCVWCNQEIKFGLFLDKAMKLRADYVATGHYVIKENIKENIKEKNSGYRLLKSKDNLKDQSYFLWTLTQKKLKRILFPVGGYTKKETKEMAKKLGILELTSKESEDICFIENSFGGFVKKHTSLKPGPIIDIHGKEIGQHSGLALYTIGQRKNIGVASVDPYYVVRLDFEKNTLVVSQNKRDLYAKELIAKKVNWISGKEPGLPLRVSAKIRYLPKGAEAVIDKQKNRIRVKFFRAQRAITPGQSVVFYKGKEVLGGGIIC